MLVCWRLDRLGRNLKHLITLLEELQALGVAFVSLAEGIDATTPAGKLQMHILGAIAGKPPEPAAVSVAFSRLARSLNLAGVSRHTLRHTGATTMMAQGVSLRAIQAIGGWSTLRMVARYAHVDDAELARAVSPDTLPH